MIYSSQSSARPQAAGSSAREAAPGRQTRLPLPATARVLVVDDDRLVRVTLGKRLEQEGHAVRLAASGEQARRELERDVDLVLLDYRLPDIDGLQLLRQVKRVRPDVLVIMLTAHSSVETAVEAMREGAYHYAAKPCDLDALVVTISRALETTRLRRELEALRASADSPLSRIVGASKVMREVKRLLAQVARSPASTVLITGETGTGKDLAARALHSVSDRRDGPFVNITCSALPPTLLEGELFGHERGAFTDAKTRKEGLIELADGGTLFLDEIGELEPAMQSKLLRFLEDKSVRRVGGTSDIQVHVRIIAATNADLQQAVRRGNFREDLYYRLAVLPVHLPPLRDRTGDVPLLANAFIGDFNREFNKRVANVTPAALRLFERHCWPGNIRELRNVIERAVLLSTREQLDVDDFAHLAAPPAESPLAVELPRDGINLRELERSLLIQALRRCRGNQVRAAALLHMSRDQIRYRIDKFRLRDIPAVLDQPDEP